MRVWNCVLRGSEVTKHSQQITSVKKKFILINITNYFNHVSIRDALHYRHLAVFLANERETTVTLKLGCRQQEMITNSSL